MAVALVEIADYIMKQVVFDFFVGLSVYRVNNVNIYIVDIFPFSSQLEKSSIEEDAGRSYQESRRSRRRRSNEINRRHKSNKNQTLLCCGTSYEGGDTF